MKILGSHISLTYERLMKILRKNLTKILHEVSKNRAPALCDNLRLIL